MLTRPSRMKRPARRQSSAEPTDKLLPRLSLAFFKRSRSTALLWLMITVFGAISFTTLLKREGFPTINLPLVIVNGSYAVDDASAVDKQLAAKVSQVALKQEGVASVNTTSEANFFSAVVQYQEKVDAGEAKQALQKAVREQVELPKDAALQFNAPYFGVTGGSAKKVDATISLYKPGPAKEQSLRQLNDEAETAVEYLNTLKLDQVQKFFVMSPFQQVTNPANGQKITVQRTFDRYGERSSGQTKFYESVIIGVSGVDGADAIKLDNQLKDALAKLRTRTTSTVIRRPSVPATHRRLKTASPNCSACFWRDYWPCWSSVLSSSQSERH